MEKRNDAKANLLYGTIESSGGFYFCPIEKSSRSKMNVVFRVAGEPAAQPPPDMETIEKKFAGEAATAGLVGTPGHRSVGGMRVSLYNASSTPPSKPSPASCANSSAPRLKGRKNYSAQKV